MNRADTEEHDAAARPLVEAAAWRVHLAEANIDSSPDFEAWLAADAANATAWRQVQSGWDFFGDQAAAPELLELRRAALGDARAVGSQRWRPRAFGGGIRRLAIAAGVLVVAAGSVVYWQSQQPDVYSTASGERRVVTLEDGSQLSLDSLSKVQVRYTASARELTLKEGQARFRVARDVERPFSVSAGDQKIVATGTDFNVDLFGASVFVTLIEGHVVVLPMLEEIVQKSRRMTTAPDRSTERSDTRSERAGRGIELSAGQQLVATSSSAPQVATVSLDRATAWQSGRLVFDNEPLSSVIARVNRYSAQKLKISDEKTSALRMSGVFNAGDADGFVSTITQYLAVRADKAPDGSIHLSAN